MPSCILASSRAAFTLTAQYFNGTALPTTGLTYTWDIPATWGRTFNSSNTVATITPDGNAGTVRFTVGNSASTCVSTSPLAAPISRQLDTVAVNPGGPGNYNLISGIPACMALSPTAYTLTVDRGPGNTSYTWNVPLGYVGNGVGTGATATVVTTQTPNISIVAQAGAVKRPITVFAVGCPTGVVRAVLAPTSELECPSGTYTWAARVPNTSRNFSINNPGSAACIPDEVNVAGIQGIRYTWSTGGQIKITDNPAVTFNAAVALSSVVTVVIEDDSRCLRTTVISPPLRPAPGGNGELEFTPVASQVMAVDRPAAAAAPVMQAFPNPATGRLTVTLPAGTLNARLTLSDATGRVVLRKTTSAESTALDVSRLPTGTYSLRGELPSGKLLHQTVQVRH